MFRLTPYGRREWGLALLAAAAAALSAAAAAAATGQPAWLAAAAAALLLWVALAAFFRDPVRTPPDDPAALVSPADGVVRDIGAPPPFPGAEHFGGRPLVRIGIFLSVLDVHVNRAPCDLSVVATRFDRGAFHDARSPLASAENQSATLFAMGRLPGGGEFPLAVKQITGAIARRIVCEAKAGDLLARGQDYGMIKFGSRTELYLPADAGIELAVAVGDVVRAGATVVARVR